MHDALELQPLVKGPLADTEAAIIRQITEEGTDARYRSTISIEAVLALAAVRAASKERRESLSNLITAAVAEYTEQHMAAGPESDELLAKIAQAVAAKPELRADFEKLLARGRRDTRRNAA